MENQEWLAGSNKKCFAPQITWNEIKGGLIKFPRLFSEKIYKKNDFDFVTLFVFFSFSFCNWDEVPGEKSCPS